MPNNQLDPTAIPLCSIAEATAVAQHGRFMAQARTRQEQAQADADMARWFAGHFGMDDLAQAMDEGTYFDFDTVRQIWNEQQEVEEAKREGRPGLLDVRAAAKEIGGGTRVGSPMWVGWVMTWSRALESVRGWLASRRASSSLHHGENTSGQACETWPGKGSSA